MSTLTRLEVAHWIRDKRRRQALTTTKRKLHQRRGETLTWWCFTENATRQTAEKRKLTNEQKAGQGHSNAKDATDRVDMYTWTVWTATRGHISYRVLARVLYRSKRLRIDSMGVGFCFLRQRRGNNRRVLGHVYDNLCSAEFNADECIRRDRLD